MKVRLVTRSRATGVFIVSQLVELEEMEALAKQVKTNVVQAIGEGLLDIVPSEASLGRLFPDGEDGIVLAMYLSQEEMRAKRAGNGLVAELKRMVRPKKPRSGRRR